MQLLTVCFNRVFDIKRRQFGGFPMTNFGFQSGDGRQCGISIGGFPELHDGQVVTAALRVNENWQSVLGWFDHDSKAVHFPHAQYALPAVGLILSGSLILIKGFISHNIIAIIVGSVLLVFAIRYAKIMLVGMRAYMALKRLSNEMKSKVID